MSNLTEVIRSQLATIDRLTWERNTLQEDALKYRWLMENYAVELLKHFPSPRPYLDAREVIDEAISLVVAQGPRQEEL